MNEHDLLAQAHRALMKVKKLDQLGVNTLEAIEDYLMTKGFILTKDFKLERKIVLMRRKI